LIIEYFKGRPLDPPWDIMDMEQFTLLQKAVLFKTVGIPYGHLRSYRDIAKAIDHPGAYRFVGTTLANNPYPILIPCHRVIRSNGKIGEFGGGAALKKQLIELESFYRPASED
jgi:methylated-DNA-[protein]-cysteine S-methyltransferase